MFYPGNPALLIFFSMQSPLGTSSLSMILWGFRNIQGWVGWLLGIMSFLRSICFRGFLCPPWWGCQLPLLLSASSSFFLSPSSVACKVWCTYLQLRPQGYLLELSWQPHFESSYHILISRLLVQSVLFTRGLNNQGWCKSNCWYMSTVSYFI